MKKLLEVPEWLKECPVANLLTIVKWSLGKNGSYYSTSVARFDIANYFLNQPFTPEMLEKYFGIKIKRDGFYNITKTKFIEFIGEFKDEFIGEYMDVYNTPRKNNWFKFPYPKTLADFIYNCKQAGIELKWRGNND